MEFSGFRGVKVSSKLMRIGTDTKFSIPKNERFIVPTLAAKKKRFVILNVTPRVPTPPIAEEKVQKECDVPTKWKEMVLKRQKGPEVGFKWYFTTSVKE